MDIDEETDATERKVEVGTESDPEVRILTLSRLFDAPTDIVWSACTAGDQLNQWFLPISGELHEGGRYEIADYTSGLIQKCRRKEFVSATWESGPDMSWLELMFLPQSSGTSLIFKHFAYIKLEEWSRFGPGALGIFWDLAFMRLASHLTRGPENNRLDMRPWAVSIEGYKFMLMSSQAWCAANISAGANPLEAQRAADRAMTAYRS